LVGIPALFLGQFLIEKWGRRPSLILSGLGMAASSIIMGGLGLSADPSYPTTQAIVAMMFTFLITFSFSWGPTVWVVCSELSTGRNRGKLMSISTGSNWFFTWLVSFTFPYLYDSNADALGARVGFIYGALMLCATAWVYFLLPETAQRSLEEIDEMFANGVPARKFSCKSH
jgi:SP family sugar:H+ symporter-like MFS transporter